MKLDFQSWLKLASGRFLDLKQAAARKPANELLTRDEERDWSAREYELHYWGATPGLWY
ncbi:hypothetical protein [Rhizobium bangladeshense]|uniref:hypothetical protein n=1 Tax=Rhizobium bangladeshense TaxID=1138189 RepID=UPI000A80662D|nr:hypothetical protein [Rhizobium bangladeshense]